MSFDTHALPAFLPGAQPAEPRAMNATPDAGQDARPSAFETMMTHAAEPEAPKSEAAQTAAVQTPTQNDGRTAEMPAAKPAKTAPDTDMTVDTDTSPSQVAKSQAPESQSLVPQSSVSQAAILIQVQTAAAPLVPETPTAEQQISADDGKPAPQATETQTAVTQTAVTQTAVTQAAVTEAATAEAAAVLANVTAGAVQVQSETQSEAQSETQVGTGPVQTVIPTATAGQPVPKPAKSQTSESRASKDTPLEDKGSAAGIASQVTATPDLLASLIAIAAPAPAQPVTPPPADAVTDASQGKALPALPVPPAPSDKNADQAVPAAQTASPAAAPVAPQPSAKAAGLDFAGLLNTLNTIGDTADRTLDAVVAQARTEAQGAMPQGFSLVANTPTADASGTYAAPVTPNTSLLSQTAVENLNALSVQINKRLSEGNTKFAMELHPADLGRVDVALTIARTGEMTAHLSFDTPVTAEVFAQHEAELRHQLAQTGLQLADDALTFSSRVKPVETAVVTHTNTENRSQDSLSQGGSQNGSSQQQALLNDQQGRQQQHPHQAAREAARLLANAGQAADAADLDAAMTAALNAGMADPTRSSSARLALNLVV